MLWEARRDVDNVQFGESPMTLSVHDLTVTYRNRPAIHRVSFTAEAGSVTGIIGPNGAGKSTVLKAAMGLVKPDTGSVTINGETVDRMRRTVAYLPQRVDLDWDYPAQVREVVTMGRYPHLRLGRRMSSADRAAVADALDRVGLTELASRQIGELSGGQQQRMLLARALAQKASTLLLDEPFVGIDAATVTLLSDLLIELGQEGVCVVVVNHDLAATARMCDNAVLLNQHVITSGPIAAVLASDWIEETYAAGMLDLESRS